MIRKAAISGLIIIIALMAASCSDDSSGPKNSNPVVSIISPTTGSTRAGIVDIIVEATDNTGIEAVELYIGNTLTGTDTMKPYSFEYDMSSAGASVSMYVKAIDISGNTTKSSVVNIEKGGSAPVITSISADKIEVMQGYPVNFSGDANDAQDGTLTDANFTWTSSLQGLLRGKKSFTYRGFVIGDHVITLSATDSNGNVTKQTLNLKVIDNDKDYAYIQEGTYTLSSPAFGERTVEFEKPFLISKYEYTLGDFVGNVQDDTFLDLISDTSPKLKAKTINDRLGKLKDMDSNPIYPVDLLSDPVKYKDYPVCFVGIVEVLEYIQALSLSKSYDVAYQFLDDDNLFYDGMKASKYSKAVIIEDSNGFRLPTECEWEVAANGGKPGNKFPWGDAPAGSRANTIADQNPPNMLVLANGRGITPVGSYEPNAFGLYDMAGNVGEMCSDFWRLDSAPYMGPLLSGTDPCATTISEDVNYYVKGGAWYGIGDASQIAVRQLYIPFDRLLKIKDYINSGIGFRLVRNVDKNTDPDW